MTMCSSTTVGRPSLFLSFWIGRAKVWGWVRTNHKEDFDELVQAMHRIALLRDDKSEEVD